MVGGVEFTLAVDDFQRARRQASLQLLLSRLTGRSVEPLSYEEVRRQLKATEGAEQELREIPLDAIVGSTSRYDDFTRSFYPRRESDQSRWASVKAAVMDQMGLPPIDVYQIGDAYFVRDGHHRVSIARQLKASRIEAYVTEVHARVPLPVDAQPDDLILLAEHTELLERFNLDNSRPEADLTVTCPGKHPAIAEHIDIHRQYMIGEGAQDVSNEQAAVDWYDHVYLPMVQLIRQMGILSDFPGRTETDLYVWIVDHHRHLEEQLGWNLGLETVARDYVSRFSPRPERIFARVTGKALEAIIPEKLRSRPLLSQWRQRQLDQARADHLFGDILVILAEQEPNWPALAQALEVAAGEGGRVHGLCVVSSQLHVEEEKIQSMSAEFGRLCRARGVTGKLSVEAGDPLSVLYDRIRWVDLLVLSADRAPVSGPVTLLGVAPDSIVGHCVRPALIVSGRISPLERLLLVTDASKQSQSALFMATYLALHRGASLAVLLVAEHGRLPANALTATQTYLEDHELHVEIRGETGPVARALRKAMQASQSDLIILGSHAYARVARGLEIPVLISF